MPSLDTARLRIHYEEAGSGPEVFVLVHGNFASWRWWKPVLDRLPAGFRALAPDLRGCGETPGGVAEDAYDIAQLAEDLAGFADGLQLKAFHLVGHSLGGAVALEYALHHPGRVRSLTLASPPPPTGLAEMREGTSDSARMMRRMDPGHRPSMDALRAGYRMQRSLGTNRWMLRRALPEMMPAASLAPGLAEALLADAARMLPEALVGFLQALHRWNVEAELPRLRVPAVIVWGEKDVLVPRAGLERMARLLPRGELVIWPDAGHSPQLERPDAFVALLAGAAQRSSLYGWRRLGRRMQRWLGNAKKWCVATSQP